MQKRWNFAGMIKEIGILTAAVAIIAAAVYFFLVPSHASVSSISGLGIVVSNFIPLPLSAITMILNVVLLVIGFLTCGKEFGAKTVYTSIVLPLFLGMFELLFPDFTSLTDSQELDVLCYILVVSIGLSILFNRNASSGGLDIVAKIMNKYLHMDLGKAMSLSGMCVALSAALVYDKKTVVLSILGTYFNGIILDHFIFDNNIKRRVCIITKKEEQLRRFIIEELHSGATVYEAIGAYNLEKHNDCLLYTSIMEEPLRIQRKLPGKERRQKVLEMLKKVGLDEKIADRYPNQLSGGQRQRVCIGEALMTNPGLLVADEAVSALDVTIQAQILELLEQLKEEMGLSILFISHDMRVVYQLCDRVMIMKDGTIVESGDVDTVYFSPQHEYTKELLEAAGIGEDET